MHMCVQTDKLGHQKYTAPQHTALLIWSVLLLDKLSLKSGKVLSLQMSLQQALGRLAATSQDEASQ